MANPKKKPKQERFPTDGHCRISTASSLNELDFFLTFRGGYRDAEVHNFVVSIGSVLTHESGGFRPGSSESIYTDMKAKIVMMGYGAPYMDCPAGAGQLYILLEVAEDMPAVKKSRKGCRGKRTFTFPALKKGQTIEGFWCPSISEGEIYITKR